MYLFYVVVYLVIYLGTLFLQNILMSLLVVKNQEISQEILVFIYLEKKKSHATFRTGHGCWSKGCETPAVKVLGNIFHPNFVMFVFL